MKHALFSHKKFSSSLSAVLATTVNYKLNKMKFMNKINPADVRHAGQKG